MRILRLRAYYAPEQTAASHLTKDMNNAYCSAGITCVNITPMPTRGVSEEVRKEYRSKKREVSEDGHIIVRRFSMYREGKNPIFRALRYVLSSVAEYCLGVREKDIDLVLGGSTPPTQGMLSALVAKKLSKKYKKHVPFVFELQDLFPESLSGTGLAKKGSFLYQIGEKISMYTYRSADKIVVISQDFKKILMEKGVPEEKIEVVYNWIDSEAVKPVEKENNCLYEKFGIDKEKFTVVYAGNLGEAQGVQTILETAKMLEQEEDIQFVIFGGGSNYAQAQRTTEEWPNVIINPLQPVEFVSQVYSLGDCAIIACKPGVGGSGMPSKTFSIMATATPILLSFDSDTEMQRLVAEEKVGLYSPAGDAQALAENIRLLHQNREMKRELGENGYRIVKERFSKSAGTLKIICILQDVTGRVKNEC